MAKTRLTNAAREAIRLAIIEHKFRPIEAGLKAEGNALAIQARAKAYGDYLPTIEAAPKGAFTEESGCRPNIAGRKISLAFGADHTVRARLFYAHGTGYEQYLLALSDTDAFAKKVVAWAERSEKTRAERSTLNDNVRGTLAAFTTFDDLKTGWPEAERFVVERWAKRPEYTANVPAVAIQALSEALDLPPEVAEGA